MKFTAMIKSQPLAIYFRPKNLTEFVGQQQVIAPGSWLYQAIKQDRTPSLVFWGPPGTGKTTLALIIAQETKAEFRELSATNSGVKELKEIAERAKSARRLGAKTILFIDEIHRWNKAQQDALLPLVENGTITLIGATTENPSFSLNSALLSRVKIVVLERLTDQELQEIINRAAQALALKLDPKASSLLAQLANGDARRALGILESALESAKDQGKKITTKLLKEISNQPNLLYDRDGEEHYNLISALHKSLRGSHPDAALYYLGRMLEAGEDPLYIARRLVRFASEDVGLANNSALLLATATYTACQQIGYPECGVNLSHCVAYLAKSAKSIKAYEAYQRVREEIKLSGNLPVPIHLRNAPTKLMKDLGYAQGYKYSPKEDDSQQEYLPKELLGKKFIDD